MSVEKAVSKAVPSSYHIFYGACFSAYIKLTTRESHDVDVDGCHLQFSLSSARLSICLLLVGMCGIQLLVMTWLECTMHRQIQTDGIYRDNGIILLFVSVQD